MIDWIIRGLVARIHQWRTRRTSKMVTEYREMFPGRCMYCGYTRWANMEQGCQLTLKPHDCIEGNGGPRSLAAARVVRSKP